MIPPKPESRPENVSLWRYARLFRRDILSAQPARLYRAWMAEFRTPFFRSFLVNQPDLVARVLKGSVYDFPKSDRVSEGLRPLLGDAVFLTNGEVWERHRRIIDPAFEGGRLRDTFPSMRGAAQAAVERLMPQAGQGGAVEIEAVTSHVAADVIFRTLFSIPIEHDTASRIFSRFRDFQRSQPLLNLAAFFPMPRWVPRFHNRRTRTAARDIRRLIAELVRGRQGELSAGTAPDDLATKIMTMADPETGQRLSPGEMVDQVAIFFLAGHETSASALGWALYLLALNPGWQEKVAAEAGNLSDMGFQDVSGLRVSQSVFREALRLYPPVPMMVRESTRVQRFRDRDVPKGAQIVISPWHLHRHERLWENPDGFDPGRWQTENGRKCQHNAFIPFSAGPRVCTGAGFAMIEGTLLLSALVKAFRFAPVKAITPIPVAHLTVRSKEGLWLSLQPREPT